MVRLKVKSGSIKRETSIKRNDAKQELSAVVDAEKM